MRILQSCRVLALLVGLPVGLSLYGSNEIQQDEINDGIVHGKVDDSDSGVSERSLVMHRNAEETCGLDEVVTPLYECPWVYGTYEGFRTRRTHLAIQIDTNANLEDPDLRRSVRLLLRKVFLKLTASGCDYPFYRQIKSITQKKFLRRGVSLLSSEPDYLIFEIEFRNFNEYDTRFNALLDPPTQRSTQTRPLSSERARESCTLLDVLFPRCNSGSRHLSESRLLPYRTCNARSCFCTLDESGGVTEAAYLDGLNAALELEQSCGTYSANSCNNADSSGMVFGGIQRVADVIELKKYQCYPYGGATEFAYVLFYIDQNPQEFSDGQIADLEQFIQDSINAANFENCDKAGRHVFSVSFSSLLPTERAPAMAPVFVDSSRQTYRDSYHRHLQGLVGFPAVFTIGFTTKRRQTSLFSNYNRRDLKDVANVPQRWANATKNRGLYVVPKPYDYFSCFCPKFTRRLGRSISFDSFTAGFDAEIQRTLSSSVQDSVLFREIPCPADLQDFEVSLAADFALEVGTFSSSDIQTLEDECLRSYNEAAVASGSQTVATECTVSMLGDGRRRRQLQHTNAHRRLTGSSYVIYGLSGRSREESVFSGGFRRRLSDANYQGLLQNGAHMAHDLRRLSDTKELCLCEAGIPIDECGAPTVDQFASGINGTGNVNDVALLQELQCNQPRSFEQILPTVLRGNLYVFENSPTANSDLEAIIIDEATRLSLSNCPSNYYIVEEVTVREAPRGKGKAMMSMGMGGGSMRRKLAQSRKLNNNNNNPYPYFGPGYGPFPPGGFYGPYTPYPYGFYSPYFGPGYGGFGVPPYYGYTPFPPYPPGNTEGSGMGSGGTGAGGGGGGGGGRIFPLKLTTLSGLTHERGQNVLKRGSRNYRRLEDQIHAEAMGTPVSEKIDGGRTQRNMFEYEFEESMDNICFCLASAVGNTDVTVSELEDAVNSMLQQGLVDGVTSIEFPSRNQYRNYDY